ncbi:MAG: Slp family lipoprotein [Gammaproteobacteria bacterium]|nr:Slp family lipoprotein [Gammaproteobacteria bacterium]
MRLLIPLFAALALSACTTVPEQIQGEYSSVNPSRVDPAVIGSTVRWGGVILGSRVEQGQTCFEVLSRQLDKYLRPAREDYTDGRFIACKAGFQDPLVFSQGREITATGTIRNIQVGKVEDYSYTFPVLDVDTLVLWGKRRQVTVYRGFSDPWHYGYPWGYHYRGWGYGPYFHRGPTRTYAEQRELLPDAAMIKQDSATPRASESNDN